MSAVLDASVETLQVQIAERDRKILYLEEQLAWFKRQLFGKSSERIVSDLQQEQLPLKGFALAEQTPQVQTVPAHQRKKAERNGQNKIQIPSDLPVETIVLDLPEKDKTCKITGRPLIKIGQEVSYKLAHRPASYYLKEIIRPKYAYPRKEGIITSFMPDSIIPKCRADESLLAEIAVRKFADHLPLYRIAEILKREDIMINRRLLSQWIVRLGNQLLPLYQVMRQKIIESKNVYVDESPVKILEHPGVKHGYMWVIVGGYGADPPYRVYDFRNDRRHANVREILGDYEGVLHSDKYGAYEMFAREGKITWCPCWAHIRRKFFEAETGDRKLREWTLAQIQQLFSLEQSAWLQSESERLHIRKEQELPIINALIDRLQAKLMEGKILPKSKFQDALGYFCSLIPYMKNYLMHPYARLDNNVAERAIRPLTLGRKNWLFFGCLKSGQAGAVLLSLVQTCRGLGINPREYLEDIFRRLMGHRIDRIGELLPDQWNQSKKVHLPQ